MNEETLLQREEKQELFYRLVDLNERGKIHWECVEYIPISFMDKDMLEGKPAYLTQMFTLTLQVQNTFYKMEIDEYLTVPDGKGDIHFKLTRPTKDNYLELETAFPLTAPMTTTLRKNWVKPARNTPSREWPLRLPETWRTGKKFWKTLSGQILPLKKG